MSIGWPQITLGIIMILGLGISLAKHGEPKEGNENLWITLLYFGGFWGGL